MTELEKIAYAKLFIDKLANGVNPLDDSPIPETDIVNNVRLSRCFFYVSDLLRQVIENGGTSVQKPRKQRKSVFALTEEERARLTPSERPLTVKDLAEGLNSVVDLETTKRISAASINRWLLSMELLKTVTLPTGKNRKLPTEFGNEIGIYSEERTGQYGTYVTVLFAPSAQQFVYDNAEAIVAFKEEENDPLSEFHGRAWTADHDERLTSMFRQNSSLADMAYELKRTQGGIRARLVRLGLIESRSDLK